MPKTPDDPILQTQKKISDFFAGTSATQAGSDNLKSHSPINKSPTPASRTNKVKFANPNATQVAMQNSPQPNATKVAEKTMQFALPSTPSNTPIQMQEVSEGSTETPILKPKSRAELYEERLKDVGLTKDKAAEILDALLTQLYYQEEVSITSKVSVTLRTRTSGVLKRLNKGLQAVRPEYDGVFYGIVNTYNLASSLAAYGEYTLAIDTDDGFASAVNFVESLPGPLFELLITKLQTFDNKVRIALSEGSLEAF